MQPLQPQDYYFLPMRDHNGFAIVQKWFWDKHHHLDDNLDRCLQDDLLPDGFAECMENVFEYDGTYEAGAEALMTAGFAEIKNPWEPDDDFDDEDS